MIEQFALNAKTKYSPGSTVGLYYLDSEYKDLQSRKTGILAEQKISSRLLNTVLRQATFAGSIIQQTIQQYISQYHSSSGWTQERIRKALSTDRQVCETGYNYSDVINKFAELIARIGSLQQGALTPITIQRSTSSLNYTAGGDIYFDLKQLIPDEANNCAILIQDAHFEASQLINNFISEIRDGTYHVRYAKDYNTTSGGIKGKFDDISTRINTLQGL